MSRSTPGGRLVIIGTGERAAIAFGCFRHDSPYEVVAFSAEELGADVYCGLPCIPLKDLPRICPPRHYLAFVAVPPSQLNRTRRRLYATVKSANYTCASYVSRHAFVVPSVRVGENTFIHERAALQHMVRVGNNVIIGAGTCAGHSTVVADDCFIGPRVAISGFCRIGRGSFLSANSCVADDTHIAEDCFVRPGAAVLKDTKPRQVHGGNPARPERQDSFTLLGVTHP